jgi:hypothetical protein
MGIYRTSRPMIVDAVQCTEAKTIATDLGFINLKCGDWVICGEGSECYVVDDAFFQRTFVAVRRDLRTPEPDERKLRVVRSGLRAIQPRLLNAALVDAERARCLTRSAGATSQLNRNESSEAKAFAQERQVI